MSYLETEKKALADWARYVIESDCLAGWSYATKEGEWWETLADPQGRLVGLALDRTHKRFMLFGRDIEASRLPRPTFALDRKFEHVARAISKWHPAFAEAYDEKARKAAEEQLREDRQAALVARFEALLPGSYTRGWEVRGPARTGWAHVEIRNPDALDLQLTSLSPDMAQAVIVALLKGDA